MSRSRCLPQKLASIPVPEPRASTVVLPVCNAREQPFANLQKFGLRGNVSGIRSKHSGESMRERMPAYSLFDAQPSYDLLQLLAETLRPEWLLALHLRMPSYSRSLLCTVLALPMS